MKTATMGKIREVLAHRRYRSMDYSNEPKIKATDQELDSLVNELVAIVEEQEKKAHLAHAPRPGDVIRICSRCRGQRWEPYIPVGQLEAVGFVCGDCGAPIEASIFEEVT